jgi:hypothetical protein
MRWQLSTKPSVQQRQGLFLPSATFEGAIANEVFEKWG